MQSNAYFTENMNFHMDIPDKLTSNFELKINEKSCQFLIFFCILLVHGKSFYSWIEKGFIY